MRGKIIAYHGSGSKITQFFDTSVTPHYFTQDKEYARVYSGGKTPIVRIDKPRRMRNYLITVELDIKHPFDTMHDPAALHYYNTQFVPHENAILAKYKSRRLLPTLEADHYVSFVYADDLYRYFIDPDVRTDYDAIYVDEGIGTHPAIVPIHASQIKVIKTEIIKPEENAFRG